MKSVVDTSAIIALLYEDDHHSDDASRVLGNAYESGRLLINDVIFSELSADPFFSARKELLQFMDDTSLETEDFTDKTLYTAGEAFQSYLDRRGKKLECPGCGNDIQCRCDNCNRSIRARQHLPADFLIGAQAEQQADRLITFDQGFFNTYFDLDIVGID